MTHEEYKKRTILETHRAENASNEQSITQYEYDIVSSQDLIGVRYSGVQEGWLIEPTPHNQIGPITITPIASFHGRIPVLMGGYQKIHVHFYLLQTNSESLLVNEGHICLRLTPSDSPVMIDKVVEFDNDAWFFRVQQEGKFGLISCFKNIFPLRYSELRFRSLQLDFFEIQAGPQQGLCYLDPYQYRLYMLVPLGYYQHISIERTKQDDRSWAEQYIVRVDHRAGLLRICYDNMVVECIVQFQWQDGEQWMECFV